MDGCFTDASSGFETRIECQVPEQCANGQSCCGNRLILGNNAYYDLVSCKPACEDPDVRLCNPLAPLADACRIGEVCKPSQLLPEGYFVCGTT
jgi:hypothetical protein